LVIAELPPVEALRSATLNPTKFLGLDKTLGTIEQGKVADLVLLDTNPLADIRNTQRINAALAYSSFAVVGQPDLGMVICTPATPADADQVRSLIACRGSKIISR
jgi:hypothetical protein